MATGRSILATLLVFGIVPGAVLAVVAWPFIWLAGRVP
jgi:hypothetical protein